MEELLTDVREQLRAVFAGRTVIFAGGFAASTRESIEQLRLLGAERFLVVSAGLGTGDLPDGDGVEIVEMLEPGTDDDGDEMANFRA